MPETIQPRSADSQSTRWLSRRQLVLVLSLALVLLLGIDAYTFRENRSKTQARMSVTHTLLVLKQALELENAALMMESSQRAYLITGQAPLLEQRDASHLHALRLANQLADSVRDNPVQSHRAHLTKQALERRYATLGETSAVAVKAGLWAAQTHFQAVGDGSVEPLRQTLASLRQEEERRLAERIPVFDRGLARFNAVLAYGTALAFIILIAAGVALLRELARADRIAEALAISNSELSAQTELLSQSNRELESFSYSVSHDLRAPLRHIDGYARMLAEDAADHLGAESQRFLKVIISSARRMGLLIDDLLSFSRLGRKPMVLQQVNMREMVERVLAEVRASSHSTTAVEVGDLPAVAGDPALLWQVWTNLLSNAIKYSAPRGEDARVVVAGERRGDRIGYRVRDNGVGFDMRYADKLFGVFQRLHPQDQFEGTGVGLAIVQRIVSRHGGQVSATAVVDGGACFTFDLPIGEAVP